MELCQIATVDVFVDDVNDHSPQFAQSVFTFALEEKPYNNTEVGTLEATDEDKVGARTPPDLRQGAFGRVKYRILGEGLPFVLFQSDGAATIYYVTREAAFAPERSYSFTVEAFDADEYPR